MENFIKKQKVRFRPDTVFYNIGKVIWLPLLIAGSWFSASGFSKYSELFQCAFRKMCGWPCPGCGGTRAVYYLFQGNFAESFRYHPAVIYGVAAYLHFMILYFIKKHFVKQKDFAEIQIQYYLYGAIVVILLQWVVKIINILAF